MDRIIANLAIDLRKLATFIRIVKTGSFSAAAASLGISQPTVTQHVQSLERALGHDLFRRHGATGRERDAAGTLLLTPAGEIAAQAAERILAEWQGTVEAIAHLDQESFYVRVGVSSVPGEHLMAGLMRHLKEHHPDAAITVESGDSGTVLQQLADGQVDMAIVGVTPASFWSEWGPRWQSIAIGSDEMVLIAPPDHPWTRLDRPVTVGELLEEPFVVRRTGSASGELVRRAVARAAPGRPLRIGAEFGSTASVVSAVASGLGVSIVSRLAVQSLRAAGQIAVLPSKITPIARSFYAVWPRTGCPAAVRALVDLAAAANTPASNPAPSNSSTPAS